MSKDNMTVEVVRPCVICHKECSILVPKQGFEDWYYGKKHIQDAMPSVPAEDRELLISGICGECFDKMFG